MSIKIEGGDGTAENVIKAGTSNELLYNDKEVLLKENFDLNLGLNLSPDLSKAQKWNLISVKEEEENGFYNHYSNPFIVPKDGWIVDISISIPASFYIKIDGFGAERITPGQEVFGLDGHPFVRGNLNCPYPVKKGQVIETDIIHIDFFTITFAPCKDL